MISHHQGIFGILNFKSHHKMSLGQEEGSKFFNYLWMAYLYNQVTLPAKQRDIHACS